MTDVQHAELARILDLLDKGLYDEALQAVITLAQTAEGTTGALAFLLRGRALIGLGQPDRAERSFRTAYSIVRYAPRQEIAAQSVLGEAAERIGMRDEAQAAYQAVLDAENADPESKAAAKSGLERLSRERGPKS